MYSDQHAERACGKLGRRLADPASIDEGDLFVACLLAIGCARTCRQEEFVLHMKGFIAILAHLSGRQSHTFFMFWPLARDEMLLEAYEYFSFCDDVVGLLSEATIRFLGPNIFQQRQKYENELR